MRNPDSGAAYLRSFWDMVTKATESMSYPPPEYAASASAIVGRPLALVNVGFSLELATEPLVSQTALPPVGMDPPSEAKLLYGYKFPVKIGDMDRPSDGVVGYFDTDNMATGKTDWEALHTYFTAGIVDGVPATPPPTPTPGDPRILIEPKTFPQVRPYYVDPAVPLRNGSFAESHAAKTMVKTMLVDPFTPLQVYTPILPVTTLQLPAWTVQGGLHKICTSHSPHRQLFDRVHVHDRSQRPS